MKAIIGLSILLLCIISGGLTMTMDTPASSDTTTNSTSNDMGSMSGSTNMPGMDMNNTTNSTNSSNSSSGMGNMSDMSDMDMNGTNSSTSGDNMGTGSMGDMSDMNGSSGMGNMSDMSDMNGSGMGGMGGMGDDMSDMGMSMYFTANSDITFLIKGWSSSTPGGAVLGCFLTFFFCFAGAYLNYFKRIYLKKVHGHHSHSHSHDHHEDHKGNSFMEKGERVNSMRVRLHLTAIFAIQTAFAGLVMLLYMTYSVYAFIAVVLGLAAGYFVAESKYDMKASSSGGHHC